MSVTVRPFLMFQGQAEEAIHFYVSLIPDSEVIELLRHGAAAGEAAGKMMKATVSLAGQKVICLDSAVKHAFTFTPSFSLFVTCESEAQIGHLASALAEGGAVLMPLGDYGFSRRFAWVNDRFGVSWQLNLE
jgi:predicted 3-demethylubiquinone-9 3-methyltransferase (glyoxalase superfamily)